VVPDLPVRENHMREHVATFLFPVQRRDAKYNVGAAVNDRGEVVILPPPDHLGLSIHEATQRQKKIRAAVMHASLQQR
jgi:hypothetical protein